MKVKKIKINGMISMNCYLIYNGNLDAIVVDPGGEVEKIRSIVKELNLNVVAIFITHSHVDHILALDCFQVPIYLSKIENQAQLSKDMINGRYMWEYCFGVQRTWNYNDLNIVEVENNEEFEIAGFNIKTIITSGHSFEDITFIINNKIAFVGDCLFSNAIGRFDYPNGCDLNKLVDSVLFIANKLDQNILCYPGHNCEFYIKDLIDTNPYVRFFDSQSKEDLNKWIQKNNIQVEDLNEYAKISFGHSIEELHEILINKNKSI